MWNRWPSTGSPETFTLWMTWTTGSSCVTRTGRHVSPSWTRSCTTLKASPWTPLWGQFDLLLSVLHAWIHSQMQGQVPDCMCVSFLNALMQKPFFKCFMQIHSPTRATGVGVLSSVFVTQLWNDLKWVKRLNWGLDVGVIEYRCFVFTEVCWLYRFCRFWV